MADPVPPDHDIKPGWKTSEFGALLGYLAQNVVLLFVILGRLSEADAEKIKAASGVIIGAALVVAAETAALWRFIASRQELKVAAVAARMQAAQPREGENDE